MILMGFTDTFFFYKIHICMNNIDKDAICFFQFLIQSLLKKDLPIH